MDEALTILQRIASGSSDTWARGLARQAMDALAPAGVGDDPKLSEQPAK